MILTFAPIALALSMAGQPALDFTGEAAVQAPSPAVTSSQEGETAKEDKKKEAKQKRGDAKKRGEGKRADEMKALRKRFDTDGDGKLNEAEGKALREHIQAERKKAGEKARDKKGAKKGKDGETPVARDKKGAQRGDRRTGGNGIGAKEREALKKRFDADGDGKLNDTERAALKKHMDAQRKEAGDEAGKKNGEAGKRKRIIKKKKAAKNKDAKKKNDDDGV